MNVPISLAKTAANRRNAQKSMAREHRRARPWRWGRSRSS
jgi:hypothetical protein